MKNLNHVCFFFLCRIFHHDLFLSLLVSILLLSPTPLSCALQWSRKKNLVYIVRYTLEILHSRRWELADGDWAGPSGDIAGSPVARCSARSRQRHLDSSSRWRLAFANKLLAAAACLLSLSLQKRLGSVHPLCEEADTPTNNETKQSSSLCLLSANIALFKKTVLSVSVWYILFVKYQVLELINDLTFVFVCV